MMRGLYFKFVGLLFVVCLLVVYLFAVKVCFCDAVVVWDWLKK